MQFLPNFIFLIVLMISYINTILEINSVASKEKELSETFDKTVTESYNTNSEETKPYERFSQKDGGMNEI